MVAGNWVEIYSHGSNWRYTRDPPFKQRVDRRYICVKVDVCCVDKMVVVDIKSGEVDFYFLF